MTIFWQAAFLLCSNPPLSGRCWKKHTSLDTENLKNYRPVSNLPFFSKITEKIVLLQLSQHLESNSLLYPLQSAYRLGHSTETALLKTVNDLLAALNVNRISLLSLLDLPAVFDAINHSILLSKLHHIFGISGTGSWFQSYISDRTQVVSVNGASSAPAALNFGVPQGSVLGPILFVLYTHPISEIVSYHSLSHHSFSDNNQLYKSGNITQLPEIIHSTQSCISVNSVHVKAWMINNQLQLNNDKTEMILIATKTVLNSDCSSFHKSGGFWLQICQHSAQPRCPSWSCSLFPTANLLRLSYLLSWTSSDQWNTPLSVWRCHQKTVVCICFFKTRLLQFTFGGPS